jgi:hypothetical protein
LSVATSSISKKIIRFSVEKLKEKSKEKECDINLLEKGRAKQAIDDEIGSRVRPTKYKPFKNHFRESNRNEGID